MIGTKLVFRKDKEILAIKKRSDTVLTMKLRFEDLTDIEINGGTSCDAYLESAFHKAWNRNLTQDELDFVTVNFNREMYEYALDRGL